MLMPEIYNENAAVSQPVIIVLGMHRSGTSLVAQLIAVWGAYMGNELIEADENNIDGYWENKLLVTLNEKILTFIGAKWYFPPDEIDVPKLISQFGTEAEMIVKEMDFKREPWCWKDPRMIFLLPFWEKILEKRKIIYVSCFRNPDVVAISLFKRNKLPKDVALSLWLFTMLKISQKLKERNNYILIEYENLLMHPEVQCKLLFNFLNESLNIKRKREVLEKMRQVVKPQLSNTNKTNIASLNSVHLELYESLKNQKVEHTPTKEHSNIHELKNVLALYDASRLYSQLFISQNGAEFKEAISIRNDFESEMSKIEFDISQFKNITSLRFDPLNDWVEIEIQKIELKIKGKNISDNVQYYSNAFYNQDKILLFNTIDSQIIIDLTQYKNDSLEKIEFHLKYLSYGEVTQKHFAENFYNYLSEIYNDQQLVNLRSFALSDLKNLNQAKQNLVELEIEYYKNKSLKLESSLLKTNQQLDEKNQQLDEKNQQLDEKNQQLDEKRQQLIEKENVLFHLNRQIHYNDIQIVELTNFVKEKDNYISTLEKKNSENQQLIIDFEINLNKLKECIKEIEAQNLFHQTQNRLYFNELENYKKSIIYKISKFIMKFISSLDLKQIGRNIIKFRINKKYRRIIKSSGLFDKKYYLQNNQDVAQSGIDPISHFIQYGGNELRNPSPNFDTRFYLSNNNDVLMSGINPLIHYIKYGKNESRPIKSICDSKYFADETPDHTYSTDNNEISYSNIDYMIIKKSGLFDEEYYLRKNPDILQAGIDPLQHFCNFGWKEGRNPSPDFLINFYLDTYKDVKQLRINPLVHYIKYGKTESRLSKPIVIDDEKLTIEADISDVEQKSIDIGKPTIAVIAHIYYVDLLDEFLQYFKNIPFRYDLIITTSLRNKEYIETRIYKESTASKLTILSYENKGRDIAPFIDLLKNYLFQYHFVCKIHTKKSNHDTNLAGWRRYLLDNLLGSDKIIEKIIDEFNLDEKLGIIYPVQHPYITFLMKDLQWGENLEIAKKIFPEHIFSPDQKFEFPSGSMFWFRPEALKILQSSTLSIKDFEEEEGQIDGTLAHAIERMLGLLPLESGYHLKKVFFPEKVRRLSNKPMKSINETQKILFVSHDLALAGAEILLLTLMRWLTNHTSFKLNIIALRRGIDNGKLFNEFYKLSNIIIWDELLEQYSEPDAIEYCLTQIGTVDLVYGNTVIAPSIYKYLIGFNAPFITHIHELEQSIKRYVASNVLVEMKEFTNIYIPCSEPVKSNLLLMHHISEEKLKLVNAFIQPTIFSDEEPSSIRKQFSLPLEKTIVWGCGTIYWRKGVDIFIQTAKVLKDYGIDNFEFIWIGSNYWKIDSEEYGTWSDWELYIVENELQSHITFLGEKDNPKNFFLAGDIFYLPSREDPYPLVCLEAAECKLPIVCFDEAGGIPSFVGKDAGWVAPYLDFVSAANAIKYLIDNEGVRKIKGETARTKLLKQHSSEIAIPEIVNICHLAMNSKPLVSVIVPVYNQEKYIASRIESILNQTFRDYEIIILDDCSTDNSYEIEKQFEYHPSISIYQNKKNSGSVFRQWQKGIEMARGKYIWIAEGDDLADPIFLETLLPSFNDKEVSLSYCASHMIDERGNVEKEYYLNIGHYANLNFPKYRWLDNYTADGVDEIANALSIRNTIPNVSAVLMRAESALLIDFDKCSSFQCGGDWFAYVSILSKGKISYSPKHLNFHRIHLESVVAINKHDPQKTLPDYFKMHKYILEKFSIAEDVYYLMVRSVNVDLRRIWPNLSDKEFDLLYNINDLNTIKHLNE